jgi:hypothetical protein
MIHWFTQHHSNLAAEARLKKIDLEAAHAVVGPLLPHAVRTAYRPVPQRSMLSPWEQVCADEFKKKQPTLVAAAEKAGINWQGLLAVLGPLVEQFLAVLLGQIPKPAPTPAPTPSPVPVPGPTLNNVPAPSPAVISAPPAPLPPVAPAAFPPILPLPPVPSPAVSSDKPSPVNPQSADKTE